MRPAEAREAAGERHVAPHTAYVAALWAVLTRMRRPQLERYPSTLTEAIGKLGPLEKAELYTSGTIPAGVACCTGLARGQVCRIWRLLRAGPE